MTSLSLWLASEQNPQLVRTEFCSPTHDVGKVAVRGKTAGAHIGAGTFQWTSAVCALTVLLLRGSAAARTPKSAESSPIFLSGTRPSLATSLDDALYKAPAWLDDVFGSDVRGGLLARRLVITTNRALHRPGPVEHSLNNRFLNGTKIAVYLDDRPIDVATQLFALSDSIERQWRQDQRSVQLKRSTHKNQTLRHPFCESPLALPSPV